MLEVAGHLIKSETLSTRYVKKKLMKPDEMQRAGTAERARLRCIARLDRQVLGHLGPLGDDELLLRRTTALVISDGWL